MAHTDYLETLFDKEQFCAAIRNAMDDLTGVAFDAIAVTGNSGAIFGGALAVAMNKSLFLVRKPNDDTHSGYRIEGPDEAQSYVFVDDCVDTGITLRRVHEAMSKEFPNVKYLGCYTYRDDCSRGRKYVAAADELKLNGGA
ncbi:MAG: phosphoribosyltransferase domain-containing protein [Acidobacteriales bacterium]|nr:phosphoribosyltransferase domain-containing protein [Terriglobales bacterium]